MKRNLLIIALLLLGSRKSFGQYFSETLPSNMDVTLNTTGYVAEFKGAYYKLETEVNDLLNFHERLRLTKVDIHGNVIWCKHYDAGLDSSLQAIGLMAADTNKMLLVGQLAGDNAFPPMGIAFLFIDSSGVLSISKLTPDYYPTAYTCNGVSDASGCVNLPAATTALTPVMLRLSAVTDSVTAFIFDSLYYDYSSLTSISMGFHNVVLGFSAGDVLTTDSQLHVTHHYVFGLQYSLPYLIQARLTNGDIAIVDDRVAGGFDSGQFRLVRLDGNLNFKWATNIAAWYSESSVATFGGQFDFISALRILESPSGNLLVFGHDEGYQGIVVTFDSSGHYLTNKVINSNFITRCSDGDWLHTDNSLFFSRFTKMHPTSATACDSSIYVVATTGTDSLLTSLPGSVNSMVTRQIYPLAVHVQDTLIVPEASCYLLTSPQDPQVIDMTLYPNPATDRIELTVGSNTAPANFTLTDVYGRQVLQGTVPVNGIDIRRLSAGTYLLIATSGSAFYRRTFIKI